jgi:hypothetical protein
MSTENGAPRTFHQLAELHVSGLLAEYGWNVYFPHRDKGFDFISYQISGTAIRFMAILESLVKLIQTWF